MDTLLVIFALYCLVAMVTFWVMFARFIGRQDLRGKSAFDLADPTDGILAFIVFFFLAFFVLALANPIRFAHLVLKAAFWPVTAWLALLARSAEGSADGAPSSRRGSGPSAPRVGSLFFENVLAREGFPATPHNVFALQERLGILFTVKAKQFMEGVGDIDDWNAFVERAGYPRSAADMPSWPQRVLDALVTWDPDVAPHLQDFPTRYVDILLEGKGTGSGFFGGSPDEPLPTATLDWAMKGLGQPDAVPVPPPSTPSVPAPRPPSVPDPVASPIRSSSDEPVTAPIRLPSPRAFAPAPSGSRKGMAVAPRSAPAAVQVIPPAPGRSAPSPARGALPSGPLPVPAPGTGRHARP